MSRSERVYRLLLRAYPARTRDASGDDMVQLFADRLRDATTRREQAHAWIEAVIDVIVTAPRERLVHRVPARVVADGPIPIFYTPSRADVAIALAPLAIVAVILLGRPSFYAPMFDPRVAIMGMPLGFGVVVLSGLLAAVGLFLARRTDLGDPQVQLLLLLWVVVPMVGLYVRLRAQGIVYGTWALVGLVLVARYRIVALSLVLPFIAWLLAGPVVVALALASAAADNS